MKITKVLCTVMMLLTLCACIDQKKEDTTTKTEETGSNISEIKKFEELSKTLSMPNMGDYSISVPRGGARPWLVGYSAPIKEHCFMLYDYFMDFAEEQYCYTIEDFKNADDVVPKMEKQIIDMALDYSNATGAGNLVVTKKENKTVNGREWIRSEAYIEAGEGKGYKDDKVHLIIYSMLRDGKPLYIAGVDRTEEQDQIELVADYTDKSIQTFRDIE